MKTEHILASGAVVDYTTNDVYIDGVRLPWWLIEDGPTFEKLDGPWMILTLPIVIEGSLTIITDDGPRVIDSVLGDVGEWARNYVREQMTKRFPDLIP